MRSTDTRAAAAPASRALEPCAISRAPHFGGDLAGEFRARRRATARPVTRIKVGSPERSAPRRLDDRLAVTARRARRLAAPRPARSRRSMPYRPAGSGWAIWPGRRPAPRRSPAAPSLAIAIASGEVLGPNARRARASPSMFGGQRRVVIAGDRSRGSPMMLTIPGHRLVGVVDVGEPRWRGPGPEMQQPSRAGFVGHAVIAVGPRPVTTPLEQAQDAAHAVDPVERRDEMHLRGTGGWRSTH